MKFSRFGILIICLFCSSIAIGQATQTFSNGATGAISDDQLWNLYPVQVNALNNPVLNDNWGFEKITLSINHTWDSDLEVWLQSPDGTEVLLFTGVGGDGDNFTTTGFKNNYTTPIGDGTAPFTGSYKPIGDLGMFNNGQSGIGTWTLKVRDNFQQDQGEVVQWSIRFGTSPSEIYTPQSSNLPIIKITTENNRNIPDDPKVPADFRIIYNGPGIRNYVSDTVYNYQGNIGIEQRGSSSAWPSKKSYGFETWNVANYSIDTSLLGMSAESDWILSASYWDKTLMRNVLSYNLANQMGHYASRTQYCEVFLNNTYMGVYILMEKIKRDNNRVDIDRLDPTDTVGQDVTGGYIVKIDKFTGSGGDGFYSAYPPANPTGDAIFYQYEYPNQSDINTAQKAYIKSYIDSFENALFSPGFQHVDSGFRKYISERDFLDYMILNEVSKNVDGYRLSTYLYKERAGKLHAGPAWDYDIAWQNANYCQAEIDTGWAYNLNYVCPGNAVPAWWERLRQDTLFNQHLYCRWSYLRGNILHTDTIRAYIDGVAALLSESRQRNFKAWPIIGEATWPQPGPIPQSYNEEIQRLKSWINTRFNWLDQQFYQLAHTPLVVSLGNDTTFCEGNQLRLFAGDYQGYLWNSGSAGPLEYATQTGVYAVTVNDKFNCTGSDNINVNVLPVPVVNLGPDTGFCTGSTIQLVAHNGTTYEWNTGDTTAAITINQAGTYIVGATGTNGCTVSDFITITELPLPDATITASPLTGSTYQFSPAGAGAITSVWYFGTGDSSITSNPTYSFPAEGVYQVTHIATDTRGCVSSDTITLNISLNNIEEHNNQFLSIYPNPATDKIVVYSSVLPYQISITDIRGRLYLTVNPQSQFTYLNTSLLPSGIYILAVETDNGTINRRFIKQ